MHADFYSTKREDYNALVREDILELLPEGRYGRVLDIGCGKGYTGHEAKQRGLFGHVTGIEIDPDSTEIAREMLDVATVGNVEEMEVDAFPERTFDCIICADVLEHLVDPWAALEKLRRWLKEDGVLVASVPNVAHITVILKILRDRWQYEEWGILDKTHLRFFTRSTFLSLFAETGFDVLRVETNASATMKFKLMNVLTFGLFKPYTVVQYRVLAKKSS